MESGNAVSDSEGSMSANPSTTTHASKVLGTPQYMAPEQFEHPASVDHRADIYALGVVFYQMLTGELPGQPIEPPSKTVRIDVRLDEVVLRALEKNPEKRYQQAGDLKTKRLQSLSKLMAAVRRNLKLRSHSRARIGGHGLLFNLQKSRKSAPTSPRLREIYCQYSASSAARGSQERSLAFRPSLGPTRVRATGSWLLCGEFYLSSPSREYIEL